MSYLLREFMSLLLRGDVPEAISRQWTPAGDHDTTLPPGLRASIV
jgi:hypothetical protein